MRRLLALTLTVLLIGMALIWFLDGGAERASSGGPDADAASAESGDAARAEDAEGSGLERVATSNAAVDERASSDAPVSSAARGVLIRVIRNSDRTPVPDAEVWWYREGDALRFPQVRKYLVDRYDRVGLAQALCPEPLRTDSRGIVFLPASRHLFLEVVGLGAGLWGRTNVRPSQEGEEIILGLDPESELTIRVVDEEDRPVAGARVGWESETLGESRAPVIWQWWTTDDDGLARIEHLSPEQLGSPPPAGISRWVALLEPFEPRIRVPWNWERPPEQPVVLKMPRHGRVVVEAKDSSGGPAADGADVHLLAASWGWQPGARGHGRHLLDGRCEFPFVGLDLDLVAAADVSERLRFDSVRGRGPSFPGETVTMRILPSAGGSALTGRIVGDAGRSAERTWSLSLMIVLADDQNRGAFGGTVRLRADGGFTIAVRKEWLEFAGKALLILTPSPPVAGELPAACAELPWPPRQVVTDLGEIPGGGELLVAGRVVNAWGEPRAGVKLSVCRTTDGADGLPRATELDGHHVRTDEEGKFRISGNWPANADRLRVQLGEQRRFDGPAFRRGQADLLVTLPPSASAQGWILADAALPNRHLVVQAIAEPAGVGSAQAFQAAIREDGTFSLNNLPAGRYSIGLHGWRPTFELTGLGVLTVGSREIEQPAEVNPLDLRGKLKFCKVAARTSDAGPLSEAVFALDLQDPWESGSTYALPAVFALPLGYDAAATCSAEGYAPSPVDWSMPLQEVVLKPLPRIPVRLIGLPLRDEEYNTVELRLTQLEGSDAESWSRGFRFADASSLVAWVPRAGKYGVKLTLLQCVPGGSVAGADLPLGDEPVFALHVPEDGPASELVLEITPAALHSALQELRRK